MFHAVSTLFLDWWTRAHQHMSSSTPQSSLGRLLKWNANVWRIHPPFSTNVGSYLIEGLVRYYSRISINSILSYMSLTWYAPLRVNMPCFGHGDACACRFIWCTQIINNKDNVTNENSYMWSRQEVMTQAFICLWHLKNSHSTSE